MAAAGEIAPGHAFCISERLPGITLQDSEQADVVSLLPAVTGVLSAIGRVDVSHTIGFGEFDASGRGQHSSWRNYLLSICDIETYDWTALEGVDMALVGQMSDEVRKLVDACPEDRGLVHGDFGANNLLVDLHTGKVTGVLDWENALYGNPLFDLAGAYFWRTWLRCMEHSAQYWDATFDRLPKYRERIRCYQLRSGMYELFDSARDGDAEMLRWLEARCREVLG